MDKDMANPKTYVYKGLQHTHSPYFDIHEEARRGELDGRKELVGS